MKYATLCLEKDTAIKVNSIPVILEHDIKVSILPENVPLLFKKGENNEN